MIKNMIRNMLKLFWIIPVENNRIVLRSSHGTKYNCNPKYISEYIQNKLPNKYQLIWIFDKNNLAEHNYLKNKNIIIVDQKSLKGILYLLTAKVIIDNHGIVSYIPIRKKQIFINTWHGGGSYKKEHSESTDKHKNYMKMMYETSNAFISSCRKFSECNLQNLRASTPEKIMEIGMPRNDIFWYGDNSIKNKVKEKLNIPLNKKIILYAPTFRYDADTNIYMINPDMICNACEKKFGGEFVFATRFHPFVEKKYVDQKFNNIIVTNSYEDMQEIIFTADVIISDYSSCLWDASLAYKPSFIYAADLDYYSEKRNFHTPIKEWPFLLAETEEDLIQNITNFDKNKYKNKVDHHHKALGSFEDGHACDKIVDYIVKKTKMEDE